MLKLYPHQQLALDSLRPGSILVGGVGSGKSLTALAYFYDKICKGNHKTKAFPLKPTNLYIITTARKRDSLEWNGELAKLSLSTDPKVSIAGIKVVVDSWNNVQKYEDAKNAFFIFDEQRVVGSGKWVRAFLKIAKNNQWILLSATPGDTWTDYIPVFVANGFYRNRTDFLRQHAIFDRFAKYPKIVRFVNTEKLEYYRRLILVTMDFSRQTVRHVNDVHVIFDKDLYDTAYVKRWNPFTNEPIQDAGQLCHILRKIVNSDDSRLEAIGELSNKHDRMIIFYNLDCELEKLRSLKDDHHISDDFVIAEWNGHRHEPLPTSERWVYLVQYTAGAEGWNCTQTNTVIFFSLNYSYKIMEQASGRIDRINTKYTDLYYYRLLSDSSIDCGIMKALKNKKTFNETAFVRK